MIIFYILIVTIAGTDGKSRLTDRCPSSILQWKRQETLFSCPADAPYHCILKYNTSQLYEACIATVTIGPGVAGCPWILFHRGVPIHGSRNSECPNSNPECPPANHKGYLSNQIYQYPACFMQRSARSSHGYDSVTSEPPMTVKAGKSNHTSEREDTKESQRNTYIALGLSSMVVVIFISSVVFCLFKRGLIYRSREGSSTRNVKVTSTLFATRWQEEDETIDMNKTGQLIQEIGNGTIRCTNEEEAVYSSNGNGAAECINEKEKLISSNEESIDLSDEDEKDTTPLPQNDSPTNFGGGSENVFQQAEANGQEKVCHEDNRKESKEAAIGYNESRQERSKESSSVKNEDFDDWTTDKEDTKEISQIERTDDMEPDSTCSKEQTVNQHTVTLYQRGDSDEDVVQRVFRSILEISDGVVSYHQLLMHFVQQGDRSDISDNLENTLKENRNVFRLLEGDLIYFVIAYLPEADICENYNPSSIAEECLDPNCAKFHVCKFHLKSVCRKQQCALSHTYDDAHNLKVKEILHLSNYTDSDINKILRNKYPKICITYDCDTIKDCPYLHICSKFCFGKCAHGLKCRFGHSFRTEHNAWILKAYGISEDEIWSGSPIARGLTIAKRIL